MRKSPSLESVIKSPISFRNHPSALSYSRGNSKLRWDFCVKNIFCIELTYRTRIYLYLSSSSFLRLTWLTYIFLHSYVTVTGQALCVCTVRCMSRTQYSILTFCKHTVDIVELHCYGNEIPKKICPSSLRPPCCLSLCGWMFNAV